MLLSQSEMGVRLGEVHPNGRNGQAFHRSTICHFERRDYKMSGDMHRAYALALAGEVEQESGGQLTISLNQRWRVTVYRKCADCPQFFKLVRLNIRRCKRCRK